LAIIGPPGIRRFVEHTLSDLRYQINFDLDFVEWREGARREAWTWRGATLEWAPLEHSAFCLGYRLEEPQRPGKFNPQQALALGVPEGAMFGRLQSGESVVTPSGQTVAPEQVLGPKRRGRVFAFATDTRPCSGLLTVIEGADIAFVEGMFAAEHEAEAFQKGHMTAMEAAKSAAAAHVERLILVHISPRYSREDETILESEAKSCFERAEVAKPLAAYPVPLPD
jgi:ribonuclease Z